MTDDSCFFNQLVAATFAAAQTTIVITVGGKETSDDPTTTFQPQRVDAVIGDTVIFNCTCPRLVSFSSNIYARTVTAGNHTATQSTFAAPCIPAHDANITINGFDSGPRDTVNGTAVTILSVPILKENFGEPFWFYDASPGACGQGAVGVINSNENGNETLAGFEVRSLPSRVAVPLICGHIAYLL